VHSSPDDIGKLQEHLRQEAFGSKTKETLVAESLAVSTADVTSTSSEAGATVASEAD
jgi:hypothetical protein